MILTFVSALGSAVIAYEPTPEQDAWLEEIEDISGVNGNIISDDQPMRDGEIFRDAYALARTFKLKGAIVGTITERTETRHKLMRVMNCKRGECRLTIDAYGTKRVINCVVEKGLEFTQWEETRGYQEFECSLFAADPYFYDTEPRETVVQTFDGGLQFPLRLAAQYATLAEDHTVTIVNDGDTACGMVITFGAGVSDIRLEKPGVLTDFMQLNMTVPEGYKLEVSTLPNQKYVKLINSATGEATNGLPYLSSGSRFFELDAGENQLRFSADEEDEDRLRIHIAWTPRYVGI